MGWKPLAFAAALVIGVTLLPTAPALAAPDPHSADNPDRLTIAAVSNPRPELVSGEEVLVRVGLPLGVLASDLGVAANGRDVTADFMPQPDGSLLGLITGLQPGANRITARTTRAEGPERGPAELRVVDHAITGPVFSGPQQQPFFCETQAFGLAPAQPPLCSAPTQVTYQYLNTSGQFLPLADPASRPADLSPASVNGRQVPYIVRLERGTIDRAVYEIAALYDGRGPNPLQPDTSWNRRLVYTFGGGCNAGFHQGSATGGVLQDMFLSQGFAVASSTLNVLNTNCNIVISAEAAMMVNQLGRDPRTGFARSPLDSVGLQYGLTALEAGQITPEQFVTLNEHIGGYDIALNVVAQRSEADPRGLQAAYRDDLVMDGGLGLAATPIIDERIYADALGFPLDIHTTEWSYSIRQRMIEQGTVRNQVMIEDSLANALAARAYSFSAMERWLSAIDADRSERDLKVKIVKDRPADLGDGCFLPGGQRILEPLSYRGTGQCASLYPVFSNPRLAAGAPLANSVLKCRLRPLEFSDYPVTFTSEQQTRLRAAFPQGVCDYREPGIGQRRPLGTWLNYGDGTDGAPEPAGLALPAPA